MVFDVVHAFLKWHAKHTYAKCTWIFGSIDCPTDRPTDQARTDTERQRDRLSVCDIIFVAHFRFHSNEQYVLVLRSNTNIAHCIFLFHSVCVCAVVVRCDFQIFWLFVYIKCIVHFRFSIEIPDICVTFGQFYCICRRRLTNNNRCKWPKELLRDRQHREKRARDRSNKHVDQSAYMRPETNTTKRCVWEFLKMRYTRAKHSNQAEPFPLAALKFFRGILEKKKFLI